MAGSVRSTFYSAVAAVATQFPTYQMPAVGRQAVRGSIERALRSINAQAVEVHLDRHRAKLMGRMVIVELAVRQCAE